MLADGFTTIGVVPVGIREVVLIDAGNDTIGEALKAQLSRRGIGTDAVKAVPDPRPSRGHTAGSAAYLVKRRVVHRRNARSGESDRHRHVPAHSGVAEGIEPLTQFARDNEANCAVESRCLRIV